MGKGLVELKLMSLCGDSASVKGFLDSEFRCFHEAAGRGLYVASILCATTTPSFG